MDITGALKDYLVTLGVDVAEVVDFEDDTEGSGCSTCYFEVAVVNITYFNSKGKCKLYNYRGPFAELIREL